MANDDDWKSRAFQEHLNVFKTIKKTYKNIPSNETCKLNMEVTEITNHHLKMSTTTTTSPKDISGVILRHPVRGEIKLSFVVIVMNIEFNGSLSKMPVFVVKTDRRRKFIDMNLTLYNSWATFLINNNLPSGQFCYPVGGQYNVGKELKIDFSSKPPAVIKEKINILWKGFGFFVAVGLVVTSFFFEIHPVNHNQTDTLLGIAHGFVPSIRGCISHIFEGFNVMQGLRSGCNSVLNLLTQLWNILKLVGDVFKRSISSIFRKVKTALSNLYDWVGQKLYYFFNAASELAQHVFMGATLRVNSEVETVESEVEEFLEGSRENNCQTQTIVTAVAIHCTQVGTENDSEYTNTVFKNAKTESALQKGIEMKGNQNLHHVTSDLLSISNALAQSLGKINLKDAQNIFEALSIIVKDEYKNKAKLYKKAITAAKTTAAKAGLQDFNIEEFNKSYGIEGNPKDHFWKEAMMSAMETRLAYSIKGEIEKNEKQKKILLLELWKTSENDIAGLYRCVGVSGAGKFSANNLINALKDVKVELNEEMLVINETSSMIIISDKDLTIAAMQELNSENTSESMVLIKRMEV